MVASSNVKPNFVCRHALFCRPGHILLLRQLCFWYFTKQQSYSLILRGHILPLPSLSHLSESSRSLPGCTTFCNLQVSLHQRMKVLKHITEVRLQMQLLMESYKNLVHGAVVRQGEATAMAQLHPFCCLCYVCMYVHSITRQLVSYTVLLLDGNSVC